MIWVGGVHFLFPSKQIALLKVDKTSSAHDLLELAMEDDIYAFVRGLLPIMPGDTYRVSMVKQWRADSLNDMIRYPDDAEYFSEMLDWLPTEESRTALMKRLRSDKLDILCQSSPQFRSLLKLESKNRQPTSSAVTAAEAKTSVPDNATPPGMTHSAWPKSASTSSSSSALAVTGTYPTRDTATPSLPPSSRSFVGIQL